MVLMNYNGCDCQGGVPKPEPLITLGLSFISTWKAWAGNPHPYVLEVTFPRDPSSTNSVVSPFSGCFARLNLASWGMEQFPQGLFLLSQGPNATIGSSTPGRLRISGFDLTFRSSFALALFDLIGLAFHYQIQLVRFGMATLGTELWRTSFMKIISAV